MARAPGADGGHALSPLGGFVDGLLQAFEDRRAGLKDDELGPALAQRFFNDLYAREQKRLRETVAMADSHLADAPREALCGEVDEFVRGVLLPAYARVATAFTVRERNDFFVARGGARVLERGAFAVGGLIAGGLIIWAPFIPLWSKNWIWALGLVGAFVPELRRVLAWRRYERELNALVTRAARELERVRETYLLGEGTAELIEAGRRLPAPGKKEEGT